MKTTHVLWLLSEQRILLEHYETDISLTDLYAMLPRHTPKAIRAHAQKVLHLLRPSRKGEYRPTPTWDRIKEKIGTTGLTTYEIAAQFGFSKQRGAELIALHRHEIYVSDWRPPVGKGHWQAVWKFGDEPDVPAPFVRRTQAAKNTRAVNPWMAAAGLVTVPQGRPGRVIKHLHDDELEAA
jgi:hypothetical protein